MASNFEKLRYQKYKSKKWQASKSFVWARDSGVCQICGCLVYVTNKEKSIKKLRGEVHHKIELTKDNIDDDYIMYHPNNLMLLCNACHSDVHKRFDKKCDIIVNEDLSIDYSGRG